jgi:arylsulfatase A-like enzyme
MIETASVVTFQAKKLIEKHQDKPFFLFLHYWDTHKPYAPPIRFYEKSREMKELLNALNPLNFNDMIQRHMDALEAIKRENIKRYIASIRYIDHEIGRLMEFLKETDLLEQTLIVITSDHGEILTEHGIFFDHHSLYDESIHVPLIFRYEGFPKGRRINSLVQHIDIVPTIVEMLGELDKFCLDGWSLLPLIFGGKKEFREAIYAIEEYLQQRRAIRTKDYKYIFAPTTNVLCRYCKRTHGDVEALYDLNQDPNESKNIIRQKPEIADALRNQLNEWIKLTKSKRVFMSK